MKKNILYTYCAFLLGIASFVNSCPSLHVYDQDIQIEEELEDSDEFLYDLTKTQYNYFPPDPPEKHLKKAMRAYDEYKYRRCYEYIKKYEQALESQGANPPYNYNQLTKEQKVLVNSYKAYCKKALKSYESAQEYFSELIDLMKDGGYKSECLFTVYWQHASCYYFIGEKEKCKNRIKRLVNMEIGPTIKELEENNYRINRQPCFHEHELVKGDKMMINEIIATSLGNSVIALQGQFIPINCTCIDEDSSFCENWCIRIGGYVGVACAFIPHKGVQAAALFALVEFQAECGECCQKGLGHDNCCRMLKKAISYALDQQRLDEI